MIVASEREKRIYGKGVEIVSRGEKTIYRLSDDTGEVVMTSYTVFDGIELIFNEVNIQHWENEESELGNILEINYCIDGRIECGFCDEYLYLGVGDMAIAKKESGAHSSFFPLKHYKGISVAIDLDRVRESADVIDGICIDVHSIAQKFCPKNQFYTERSSHNVEHIFSELYNVPKKIQKEYFKLKVLELLLFLSAVEPIETQKRTSFSKMQVELAKSVCKFLTEHMSEKITLEQLSKVFHVSGTLIKTSFKGVYGETIYSYIRGQKMREAARMLKETENSVIEIAGTFGYENASKFAAAFRDVMGNAPGEYRKTCVQMELSNAQTERKLPQ